MTQMGPSRVPDERTGVRYHRRYLKPTPFVMAAFITLACGAAIAVVHSRLGTLFGLIALFTFLTLFYLDGPAKSVTVRDGMLEVRNSIHRYEIPPSRILSIEHVVDLGVLVRVEDREPIWVGTFSRTQVRWRRLSTSELQANAKSLTDALLTTPAPADHRPVAEHYRWGNVLLTGVVVIALLCVVLVANSSCGQSQSSC